MLAVSMQGILETLAYRPKRLRRLAMAARSVRRVRRICVDTSICIARR